jgi:methylated-DNA-[protein]-cysteine S-methyltransferase
MSTTTNDSIRHTVIATGLGDLTVVRDGHALIGLYFPHHWYQPDPSAFGPRVDVGFDDVRLQLEEYLAGHRESFDLEVAPRGDLLQHRVWDLVAQVPYGQTTTYGAIARRLSCDVTAQQIGVAVGRNPLCIVVPCHRVVSSTGKLTGYAGGLERKRQLLDLEQPTLLSALEPALRAVG